jgi:hypothetical protein
MQCRQPDRRLKELNSLVALYPNASAQFTRSHRSQTVNCPTLPMSQSPVYYLDLTPYNAKGLSYTYTSNKYANGICAKDCKLELLTNFAKKKKTLYRCNAHMPLQTLTISFQSFDEFAMSYKPEIGALDD